MLLRGPQTTSSIFLLTGALFGASGVVLGAFGAHALGDVLAPDALSTWQTAVQYQLIHAVALVLTAVLRERRNSPALTVAGWSLALGVVLFSGSLYLLVLGGPRFLGPVTPVGGVSFVIGWAALAFGARAPR